MRWIFWGTLWQSLSIAVDLNGLQFRILPLFVCYFMVMRGCRRMTEESDRFRTCQTVYLVIMLCMLAAEAGEVLGLSTGIWLSGIELAEQFGRYLYLRGIQEMEGRYGGLGGQSLMTTWKVATVCVVLAYPMSLLQDAVLPGILYIAVTLCAAIWFLVLLYRAWKTYQTRYEQVYAANDAWNKEDDLL